MGRWRFDPLEQRSWENCVRSVRSVRCSAKCVVDASDERPMSVRSASDEYGLGAPKTAFRTMWTLRTQHCELLRRWTSTVVEWGASIS